MCALIVQQGLLEELKGSKKMDVVLTEWEKAMMIEKGHNAIIPSLDHKVLMNVSKEKIEGGVWIKLKILYMAKSLVNRLYLK